jgi:hypothetical protein
MQTIFKGDKKKKQNKTKQKKKKSNIWKWLKLFSYDAWWILKTRSMGSTEQNSTSSHAHLYKAQNNINNRPNFMELHLHAQVSL